jgi:hypothetical protein
MKQKKFLPALILIASLVAISSCQKSVTETKDEVATKRLPDGILKNQCQLTRMNVEGFDNQFHYNDKGLVDEWTIDFGFDFPDVYTMEYDNDNKLSRAWYHYDGQLFATINFEWTGSLLTKENWDYSGFLFDVINIYDRKGQMIKREASYGHSAIAEYSSNGNIPVREIYFAGELQQRNEYTFYQPNKNPFLAIRGLPYGFPFVIFDFSKWWETSEKIIDYTSGSPVVAYDYDPAQTVMQIGFQNYPTLVTHYDLVTNTIVPYSFEYQNCGPDGNTPTRINNNATQQQISSTRVKKTAPAKVGPPEMIRKQLQQRRK